MDRLAVLGGARSIATTASVTACAGDRMLDRMGADDDERASLAKRMEWSEWLSLHMLAPITAPSATSPVLASPPACLRFLAAPRKRVEHARGWLELLSPSHSQLLERGLKKLLCSATVNSFH